MASVSLQTNVGVNDSINDVGDITTGTAVPTSKTFEFRMNQGTTGSGWVPTRQDAIRALEAFIRYIEDTNNTFGTAL